MGVVSFPPKQIGNAGSGRRNAGARILHLIISKGVLKRTQAWRFR